MKTIASAHPSRRGAFARAACLLVAFTLILAGGCKTLEHPRPKPVAVAEIVQMSRDHVPPEVIIDRIHQSGTVYRLSASQLADLRTQGVPNVVIDYMQETYLEAVRHDQALQDWNHYTRYPDSYWYGGYPFGWPWWPEPVIIVPPHHRHHH